MTMHLTEEEEARFPEFIGEKPLAIHRSAKGLLHRDGGLAVEYFDGFGIYALNGIRMKPEYVLTAAEQIDPGVVLQEPNAEQRRELIRKIGVERMLAKLEHESLDKRGNYELISVRLSDHVTDARYLKRVNPSVGVFHLEGVAPKCKTVSASLKWRNRNWQICQVRAYDWFQEMERQT